MVKKKRYIEPLAKSWVEDATKLIKFKDDRLRVQAELLDHIEDASDAWKEAGYDDYEAKKKAVSNMGDAAEVANNLADIYRPFWGRLWKLTKIIRNLLIVAVVFAVISNVRVLKYILNEENNYFAVDNGVVLSDITYNKTQKIEGYTVKLKRVQMVDIDSEYYDNFDTVQVKIDLDFISFNPYRRGFSISEFIQIEDDIGNIYNSDFDFDSIAWTPEDEWSENSHERLIVHGTVITANISDKAKIITLNFERFGEKFSFTIPLERSE